MATSSKKTTPATATGTSAAKKPVVKKSVSDTTTSKATAKKTPATAVKPATPVKKVAAATPAKKTAAVVAKVTKPATVKKAAAVVTKEAKPAPAEKVSVAKAEAPASKKTAPVKSTAKTSVKKITVTPEQRYNMIQTAAYFRAEQRGFSGGYAMEDWIYGEAQIDAMLNT